MVCFQFELLQDYSANHHSNWMIYRDEARGFEFRYPAEADVSVDTNYGYSSSANVNETDHADTRKFKITVFTVDTSGEPKAVPDATEGPWTLVDWHLAKTYVGSDLSRSFDTRIIRHDGIYFTLTGRGKIGREIMKTFHLLRD